MRRRVAWLVAGVSVVAVVVLFVLPGRTLLHQRASLRTTEQQVRALQREDAKLQQAAASLQTDAEIERLARQRYGLVMPGEQAYVVLPHATPAAPAPPPPTAPGAPTTGGATTGGPPAGSPTTTPGPRP